MSATPTQTRRLALLRGVNVGGHRKVPMADLRSVAAGLGWSDPETYIASGNLLFTASGSDADLAVALGSALVERFGFAVDVIVVGGETLRRASASPFADGDPKRVHVAFCPGPMTDAQAAKLRTLASGAERLEVDGELIHLDFADGVASSKLATRLSATLAPGFATARNLATVRTLGGLLRRDEGGPSS